MRNRDLVQSNFMILLAGFIGSVLSLKWLLHEISVIIALLQSDMEVSWSLYVPLIIFIFIIFLISIMLFIGSFLEFKTKAFFIDSQLKVISLSTLLFNVIIVATVLVNEYIFNGIKFQYAGISLLGFLIFLYLYLKEKHSINIFYFLTVSAILSALFWGTMYILF